MDSNTAKELIKGTFNFPFEENRFRNFAINLLNSLDEEKSFSYISGNYIKDKFKPHIAKYRRLGTYTDPNGAKIDVLVVQIRNEWALERSRATLRNFIADYLSNRDSKDAALVAYYSANPDDWRFSYIRMEYKLGQSETGKVTVKKDLTPAKRYSFLVGKNEPNHTAQAQLIPILEDDHQNPTLQSLESAFSVDKVTKQFYSDYRGLYEKLKIELDAIVQKNKKIKLEFEHRSLRTANFSKKLMGQIVFLYFLQKKGWLGIGKNAEGDFEKWGKGPKNFLKRLLEKEFIEYNNFFNDILEPLFYEALATERPDNVYSRFNCKIPFLNGGLFEPLNEYNWIETDIRIDNKLFEEIFQTFDRYNFTVREDEPLETEVAVDPEMLGKVFENLIEENERKGRGAFYTPRAIVHYMCQESLINYLKSSIDIIPLEDIETLIREGDIILELESAIQTGTDYSPVLMDSIKESAADLDTALSTIRVCDPAVGSGAFPVGMLSEIVKAREVLQLYSTSNQSTYELKRHSIQHSLYGVDLDPGAIEIAKLRLWLSLVVDENDYNTIQPLPNLDYKIMQGNSLIEDFHGILLNVEKNDGQIDAFSGGAGIDLLIENLHEKQTQYFNAEHPIEKANKRADVEKAIYNVFHHELKKRRGISPKEAEKIESELRELTHGNKTRNFFPWKLYFADVFREKGGFDVMIANPPYLKERDNATVFSPVNNSMYGEKYHQGKMDYWYYFLHRALDNKNNDGGIAYITSRYWLQSSGASKLINRLGKETQFVSVLDIGKVKVFDNVVGQHIVSLYGTAKENKTVYKKVKNSIDDIFSTVNTENLSISILDTSKIIKNSEIRFEYSAVDFYQAKKVLLLGEILDCSQGVVEAPDKISRKAYKKNPIKNVYIGDGVFVLGQPEFNSLGIEGSNFVKQYLDPNAVGRYSIDYSGEYLIYSDKEIKEEIKIGKYQKVKNHLDKYEAFITSSNRPYGIHRARKRKYFESPKLICKSMFSYPSFTYDDEGFYVGFSFTVMIAQNSDFILKYILAILNSKLGHHWFVNNGKKRGIGVDVGVIKFRQFPIVWSPKSEQRELAVVVDKILEAKRLSPDSECALLENIIDEKIYHLYNLSAAEIKIIEETQHT